MSHLLFYFHSLTTTVKIKTFIDDFDSRMLLWKKKSRLNVLFFVADNIKSRELSSETDFNGNFMRNNEFFFNHFIYYNYTQQHTKKVSIHTHKQNDDAGLFADNYRFVFLYHTLTEFYLLFLLLTIHDANDL